MRVAFVTPGFPPDRGGVETVVGQLARGFVAAGHSVTVLAPSHERGRQLPEALEPRLVIERYTNWSTPRFVVTPGLWKRVRAGQVEWDVLSVHGFHSGAALPVALATDLPFVFTPHYHGGGHTRLARALHVPYDRMARLAFQKASVVVCVSDAEAALVCRDYPVAATKIQVIPNGVDVPGIRVAEPWPSQPGVILSVGRLEEYKQVDVAIRAMLELDDETRLVIVGTGIEAAALQRLVKELGLTRRVEFVGAIETAALRRWQRSASVAVTLSRHEAFGLVLVEALVAGSRVVATDLPAHREVARALGDELPVVWVPVNASPAAVAAAIGEATRLPIAPIRDETFLLSGVVQRTIHAHEEVVRKKPATGPF